MGDFLYRQGYKWMVPKQQYPVLVGHVPKGNQKSVFEIAPKDFTVENLNEFADKIANGIVDGKKFKSEPVPSHTDGFVRKIVGDNFKKVALDKTKHVVIYVYDSSKNQEDEQNFADVFEETANSMHEISDLSFGKIDMALNELSRTEIKYLEKYPAFFFYPKDTKKKPVQFKSKKSDNEFTHEKLKDFIFQTLDAENKKIPPPKRTKKDPKKGSKQELKQ